MMTVTVDVINNDALDLLRAMEAIHFIHLETPVESAIPEAPIRQRLTERQREAIEKCWGIAKGVLSSDEILEWRREDKALEEAKYQRLYGSEGGGSD
jgi:hypothetical protein